MSLGCTRHTLSYWSKVRTLTYGRFSDGKRHSQTFLRPQWAWGKANQLQQSQKWRESLHLLYKPAMIYIWIAQILNIDRKESIAWMWFMWYIMFYKGILLLHIGLHWLDQWILKSAICTPGSTSAVARETWKDWRAAQLIWQYRNYYLVRKKCIYILSQM